MGFWPLKQFKGGVGMYVFVGKLDRKCRAVGSTKGAVKGPMLL
jgi:hypothetical protein